MPVIWYTLTFYSVPDSQPEKNILSPLFIGALNVSWFLPFKVCLQRWLELSYLSLLSVLWDQPLLLTYFCSLVIVPCFHLWFPWGSCMEYTVTLGVSCSSLSAQVLWHKQIKQEYLGASSRQTGNSTAKFVTEARLINCQTQAKVPETVPWGSVWRLEWCKMPASSIMWFCIRDRRILLKTCQALSFDVLLFDPPVAL